MLPKVVKGNAVRPAQSGLLISEEEVRGNAFSGRPKKVMAGEEGNEKERNGEK